MCAAAGFDCRVRGSAIHIWRLWNRMGVGYLALDGGV